MFRTTRLHGPVATRDRENSVQDPRTRGLPPGEKAIYAPVTREKARNDSVDPQCNSREVLRARADSLSSISHARNIKKTREYTQSVHIVMEGASRRAFAIVGGRLIGLIKSIRCSTSLYAP